jgi:hypothetical protein
LRTSFTGPIPVTITTTLILDRTPLYSSEQAIFSGRHYISSGIVSAPVGSRLPQTGTYLLSFVDRCSSRRLGDVDPLGSATDSLAPNQRPVLSIAGQPNPGRVARSPCVVVLRTDRQGLFLPALPTSSRGTSAGRTRRVSPSQLPKEPAARCWHDVRHFDLRSRGDPSWARRAVRLTSVVGVLT